jgi:GMP synthase (glutamine-hydrolysing)
VADNHGVLENEELKRIMQEWPGPQLAICYSAQLAVRYGGGRVEDIGPLDPGEHDPNPHYRPGMKKEFGVYPVTITRSSGLFAGLGSTIMVSEEHALEIKELPAGFIPLAHSDLCAIQAYEVEGRPFYGVQFHPEKHRVAQRYGDGAGVLRNFFAMAGKRS